MTATETTSRDRARRARIGVERALLGWGMAIAALLIDRWVRRATGRANSAKATADPARSATS